MSEYKGQELELFLQAKVWKAYWGGQVRPHVRGDVLDVGAGLGENTGVLHSERVVSWTYLEPDSGNTKRIQDRGRNGELPRPFEVIEGYIDDLPSIASFDTILYLDVLEHIEDDAAEIERAAAKLHPGGSLIVLSPAHERLFSPFDVSIGHYRRYDRRTLMSIVPDRLRLERMIYLDSIGVLASMTNRLLLKNSYPTESQILTWDRMIVPVSQLLDPLLGWRVGKSILGVWKR